MFKNNCEVGQKFDFSGLIFFSSSSVMLNFGLMWGTEYSLHIFQKRSINTFQGAEEALGTVAVIQYGRAEKKAISTYPEKRGRKKC